MKAAIYGRVSTDRQSEISIEAQVEFCRAYCQRNGLEIHEIYTDYGITGTSTDKRQALQRLMSDAKSGLFQIVVAHKVDRAFRNVRDYENYKFELQQSGIMLAFAESGSNNDPNSELMNGLFALLAQFYSQNLSRETKKGTTIRAKAGQFMGGVPPFGYRISQDKKYEIDPDLAPVVREIFERYADGQTMRQICDWLNPVYKTTRGGHFKVVTIHEMLKNEKYAGVYTYNKNQYSQYGTRKGKKQRDDQIRIEGILPAIIERELFERVAEKMKMNRQGSADIRAKRFYLLSGLMVCGECGSPMVSQPKISKSGIETIYYTCSGHKKRNGCTLPLVRQDWAEENVVKAVERLCNKIDVSKLLDQVNKERFANYEHSSNKMVDAMARKRALESKGEKVAEAVANIGLNDALRKKLEDIERDLMAINQLISQYEIERGSNQIIDPMTIAQGISLVIDLIKHGEQEEKRDALRSVVKKIKIDRQVMTVYLSSGGEDEMVAEVRNIVMLPIAIPMYWASRNKINS